MVPAATLLMGRAGPMVLAGVGDLVIHIRDTMLVLFQKKKNLPGFNQDACAPNISIRKLIGGSLHVQG